MAENPARDESLVESNYIKSIRHYGEACSIAAEIANDVFKAPEQVVETARAVVAAAWEMQVQYAALVREQ